MRYLSCHHNLFNPTAYLNKAMGKHSFVVVQNWALHMKTYTCFIFAGKHTLATMHCSATLNIVI